MKKVINHIGFKVDNKNPIFVCGFLLSNKPINNIYYCYKPMQSKIIKKGNKSRSPPIQIVY